MVPDSFYITTPIYYGNARPHLGTLYSTVLADVLARHARLQGKPVRFLTGTDEHGLKIAQAAAQAGMPVQDFVDAAIPPFIELFKLYGISYTDFMRTTKPFHIQAVQAWIRTLMDQGDIYKGVYEGWYCVPCETFVTSKDVTAGEHDQACPTCGRPLQLVSEPCYFFKLSAYQDRLLAWYEQHPEWVLPRERLAEVVSFVSGGLKDLAISRSKDTVQWGIPFPGDDTQLVYVWADALNNYITALGYGQEDRAQELNHWWPAHVQVMGKDIIRFHAVYWPAFLMAAGLDLPKHLLVHGWIKVGGDKMSKSKGNAVDPVDLASTYGVDQVRYYMTRYMAITHDAPFSHQDLALRINTDLANDLGNLVNRVMVMVHKYAQGRLIVTPPADHPVVQKITQVTSGVIQDLELGKFHTAYQQVADLIHTLNAHIHTVQPWALAKTNLAQAQFELGIVVYGLEAVSVLLSPVMPTLMETVQGALGITLTPQEGVDQYQQVLKYVVRTYTLGQPFVLCPRIEQQPPAQDIPPLILSDRAKRDCIEGRAEKTHNDKNTMSVEPVTPNISFEHFSKVQLAVGLIEAVEAVPKSSKLYELTVNFGTQGTRTILSGIQQHFAPQDLLGKQAVFVLNLEPRALMGKQSHGMLLTAKTESGALTLVAPGSHVAPGTILS